MKKIYKKMIIVLTICFFTIILNVSTIYAFTVSDLTGTTFSNSELSGVGNSLITIITTIGSVVSVIVLIILGLKYMMGSVEEKAAYKKTLLPYVIGAALVFAASAIAGILYSFLSNLS